MHSRIVHINNLRLFIYSDDHNGMIDLKAPIRQISRADEGNDRATLVKVFEHLRERKFLQRDAHAKLVETQNILSRSAKYAGAENLQ